MRILVIVVCYNGLAWLDRCLGSVRESTLPADLYVLDNASSDGTADGVAARFPEAILIRSSENLGFARGNNEGLKYALEKGYDAVYLLNQDACLEPDTLAAMAAVSTSEWAVLSPMQLSAAGAYDPAFERDVLPKAGAEENGVRAVPRVMAAHWLIRRDALEKVGLFAPLFPLYGEDDNWCDRARFLGLRIGIVPAAKAVHDRARRQDPLPKRIHRDYYMGSLRRLCDISRCYAGRWVFTGLFTLVKCVKYGSLQPLKYFGKLVGSRKEIRRTRALTRQPHAYL